MRAVWSTGFGGPEVLVGGDAPEPVVVDVAYAGVTFVETRFRRARHRSVRDPAARAAGATVVGDAAGRRRGGA